MDYEVYKELRDKKGVTDYKVAQETGISPTTLYDWKAGRSKPKLHKALKIARYFGVPVETFERGNG